ncbi:MAG: glycosyltransferase family 2 protein [Eubacteriales bacterium]|nr:glycosyltransferase family 2 protein [Eubacteriales bacterium]
MFTSWREFLEIIKWICSTAMGLMMLTFCYDIFLIICGIPKNRKLDHISHTVVTPKTRFALLISARDEESVIGRLLDCLNKLDYPRELYQVFVIADNCQDRTAALAREYGAQVYERHDLSKATKGYALGWFFQKTLPGPLQDFDHCVIFDADNLVDKDFLKIMDRQVQAGGQLLVGYRDSTNPGANVIAGSNALFWYVQSRFMHHARGRLGLALTSVSGTGFSFDLDLIREQGWHTQTVTEDVEFTMQMILRGVQGVYVRQAIFYDEQVTGFRQMLRQRLRWSVGTVQTLRLYGPALWRRSVKVDWHILDSYWFLARIPVMLVASIFYLIVLLIRITDPRFVPKMLAFDLIGPLLAYLATVCLLCLLLKLEKKNLRTYLPSVLAFPFLGLLWGGIQVIALFFTNVSWQPIYHGQEVEISSNYD